MAGVIFSGRGQDRRAIVTTLNLNQPIVQRALSVGDESLIALLLGIPTAEGLLYRRASNPWLDPVFKQLRAILFPGKEIYGVPFVSASLADSAPFKRIAARSWLRQAALR